MNLLLDTNIIIDYMGRKEPFFEDAERIVAAGYFGDAVLWAPAQSFEDACYVLSHYVDQARVQGAILKLMEIVAPVDLAGSDIAAAVQLKWGDLEDCLVAVSASKAGADYIITRDRVGFERSMVPAIAPADWLREMREARGVTFGTVPLD